MHVESWVSSELNANSHGVIEIIWRNILTKIILSNFTVKLRQNEIFLRIIGPLISLTENVWWRQPFRTQYESCKFYLPRHRKKIKNYPCYLSVLPLNFKLLSDNLNWNSCILVKGKPNRKLRICTDPNQTINRAVKRPIKYILTIEEKLPLLTKASIHHCRCAGSFSCHRVG